jgi:hypothetical protein
LNRIKIFSLLRIGHLKHGFTLNELQLDGVRKEAVAATSARHFGQKIRETYLAHYCSKAQMFPQRQGFGNASMPFEKT